MFTQVRQEIYGNEGSGLPLWNAMRYQLQMLLYVTLNHVQWKYYNDIARLSMLSRSFGKCLRNHVLSGCTMRFTTRSFGCTLRRVLYWELKWQISSLTVGICRSFQYPYSARTRVCLQSRAKLQIGSVLGFVRLNWKLYHTVVFHRSRLLWVLLCIWEFYCVWRVLTSIQVADTFWRASFSVVSVLSICDCTRQVSCQGATWGTWHHLIEKGIRCLYGLGAGFSSCGECDMDQLGFISFYPPSL
jgi:hypothetical protein